MSCNVLVTSEAGVKLYYRRLTKTLPKLKRHPASGAGNVMPASYVTGRSDHLTTAISHSWVHFIVYWVNSKELETTRMVIRLFEYLMQPITCVVLT